MGITEAIEAFEGISLEQMDQVKLMNRTDRKYWFNVEHLPALLDIIKDDYYLLEIKGQRNMPYSTTYYDTPEDQMYLNHHRGKLNRFKIRRRSYVSSGISFLEVKFKSNKGRTIKDRIPSSYAPHGFNQDEDIFISEKTPYTTGQLQEVLINRFNRLMLVSKDMNERCTIDLDLTFVSNGVEIKLEQLAVVEVKSQGRAKSNIIDAMHGKRLKPSGFSKYCMGRSLSDSHIKSNSFRLKHRQIAKHINTPINQLINVI
ncbi:MAG: polyphosphate polymerase domain-containing protein [Rikenellaceae bacterium]